MSYNGHPMQHATSCETVFSLSVYGYVIFSLNRGAISSVDGAVKQSFQG